VRINAAPPPCQEPSHLFETIADQADPENLERSSQGRARMASLKEAAAVTEQLEELAGRLHEEVMDGRADLREMSSLADQIGELADAIAATLFSIDAILLRGFGEPLREAAARRENRQRGGAQTARRREQKTDAGDSRGSARPSRTKQAVEEAPSPVEEVSRDDLLERARELEISGRSTMSKEELLAAIQSEEQVTKEELLDRAREAGVAGRSSMSKEELAEAVRSEESLSREELLERAREADIPGRSEMSKEELREALSSQ
jgi:hypothetical protein